MVDNEDPWWCVRPPADLNGSLTPILLTVDSLKRAWETVVTNEPPEQFRESRARNLRRHAIETGIIERLYDVDWGVTEALVAEGLSSEVAAREGGIDESALSVIKSQFEALTFLSEAARDEVELSPHLIRQLHAVLCRSQSTYEATDQFGRKVVKTLNHGAWKSLPNQAITPDGGVRPFAPPEQVSAEVERLIQFYRSAQGSVHPLTLAAWLHHSFVVIHPFDDGNGRVARALALLVLLRNHYAPLVVDRFSRSQYLEALERANDGDLSDLIRLFARLEIVALRSELERPQTPASSSAGAVEIARAYVDRLAKLRDERATQTATRTDEAALAVLEHIKQSLQQLGTELEMQFKRIDKTARVNVFSAAPPQPEARYWHAQIVRAANEADFYSNLANGTWWANLRLTVFDLQMRMIAVVQKVGHGETGVLAVTTFAEQVTPFEEGERNRSFTPLLGPGDADSVTLVADAEVEARFGEIDDMLNDALAIAVERYARNLA